MSLEELYREYECQDSNYGMNCGHEDNHYDTPHIQEYVDEP